MRRAGTAWMRACISPKARPNVTAVHGRASTGFSLQWYAEVLSDRRWTGSFTLSLWTATVSNIDWPELTE